MARPRSGVCAEADADERESSKVVKTRLVGLAARRLQLHAFGAAATTAFKDAEAR